jgi:hypothetical protein
LRDTVERTSNRRPTREEVEIPEAYQVLVECASEKEQRELYDQLVAAGKQCRLLML